MLSGGGDTKYYSVATASSGRTYYPIGVGLGYHAIGLVLGGTLLAWHIIRAKRFGNKLEKEIAG